MPRAGYGSVFGFFIAIVSLILGGAFVYKSVAKVNRLRAEVPAEFLQVNPKWSKEQKEAEARLGRAYWECARTLSRTTFGFSDRLPDSPPAAFSVDAKSYPSLVDSHAAARARYWRNLQEVWNDPEAWERIYEWHTSWFFQGTNY